jgi:dTDP-4-amino-4,6-dideoxygalactose transaminase
MWSYKDHGKSWEAVYERQHPPGFRWVHESFGTNWRMLEVQAVIGRIQLRRMSEWTARRAANAAGLAAVCRRFAIVRVPEVPEHSQHAWYRLYAFIRPEKLPPGWTRDRIIAELAAEGVPCYQGSCSEIYREKAFDGTSFRPPEALPVARTLGATSLMFLVHPTLTDAELQRWSAGLGRVLARAAGALDPGSPAG